MKVQATKALKGNRKGKNKVAIDDVVERCSPLTFFTKVKTIGFCFELLSDQTNEKKSTIYCQHDVGAIDRSALVIALNWNHI